MKEAIDAVKNRIMKEADPSTGWRVYDPSETDFSDLMTDIRTVSFFGGLRGILAVNISLKGESGKKRSLGEEEQKQLIDYMENPSPDVALIISTTGADFRQKFWKTLKAGAKAVAFESNESSDKQYVAEKLRATGLEFTNDAKTWLRERFVNGTRHLHTELEKLAVYMGESTNVTLNDLENCMNVPGTESIFMLTDAIGNGRVNKSLLALSSLKTRGEEFFKVLPMIAWHIRKLLALKSCENEAMPLEEKARRCGVNFFFFKKNNYERQAANFTIEKLKTVLYRLSLADVELKKSPMSKWTILEKEIISLINKIDPKRLSIIKTGNP